MRITAIVMNMGRACRLGPALDPSCQDCIDHLGPCLVCHDCRNRRRCLMLARMVEMASTATLDNPESTSVIHDV